MAKKPEIDDLDALIDKAVDTFFVEAPTPEERSAEAAPQPQPRQAAAKASPSRKASRGPSFDEAVSELFMEPPSPPSSGGRRLATEISSGDPDIDKAIDLAVETLFIEEPDIPPPETTQLQTPGLEEIEEIDEQIPAAPAPPGRAAAAAQAAGTGQGEASKPSEEFSYNDAMAMAIARHVDSLYNEAQAPPAAAPAPAPAKEGGRPAEVSTAGKPLTSQDALALRRLQEAILTLEWEISRRSVAVLAGELNKVRSRFQENIAVDFAATSMRIVLEYVASRMSRAHPESVRFLLEVTDLLERLLASGEEDPLQAFHQIVERYETYKLVVRQAEGLPNRNAGIVEKLEIKDPEAFARLVDRYALTLSRAGRSLAKRLKSSGDPENLIRSFRFLVTRSMNRLLDKTLKEATRGKRERDRP